MSGYNYENFIKEFTDRTMENYNIIKDGYIGTQVESYEVTQLINSLFGLLIVPNEKYKYRKNGKGAKENTLKRTESYKEIEQFIERKKGEGCLYNDYDEQDQHKVSDFIRHMRNSLSHSGNGGLHFLPIQENKDIEGVIFYDNDEEYGGKHQFCLELCNEEIFELAKLISEMYSTIESYKDSKEKIEEYENEISRLRGLLQSR